MSSEKELMDNLFLECKMQVFSNLSGLASNALRSEVYKAVDDAFKDVSERIKQAMKDEST